MEEEGEEDDVQERKSVSSNNKTAGEKAADSLPKNLDEDRKNCDKSDASSELKGGDTKKKGKLKTKKPSRKKEVVKVEESTQNRPSSPSEVTDLSQAGSVDKEIEQGQSSTKESCSSEPTQASNSNNKSDEVSEVNLSPEVPDDAELPTSTPFSSGKTGKSVSFSLDAEILGESELSSLGSNISDALGGPSRLPEPFDDQVPCSSKLGDETSQNVEPVNVFVTKKYDLSNGNSKNEMDNISKDSANEHDISCENISTNNDSLDPIVLKETNNFNKDKNVPSSIKEKRNSVTSINGETSVLPCSSNEDSDIPHMKEETVTLLPNEEDKSEVPSEKDKSSATSMKYESCFLSAAKDGNSILSTTNDVPSEIASEEGETSALTCIKDENHSSKDEYLLTFSSNDENESFPFVTSTNEIDSTGNKTGIETNSDLATIEDITESFLNSLMSEDKTNNETSLKSDIVDEKSTKPSDEVPSPNTKEINEEEDHVESKKFIGSPIIAAMKKMVETPIQFLKSKSESISPTRKKNKEVSSPKLPPRNANQKSPNVPKKGKKSKNKKTVEKVMGSPELPPRNKASVESSVPSSKSKEGGDSSAHPPKRLETSPILSLKNGNKDPPINITDDAPRLPPRNGFPFDDPKKFNSLQPRRSHNGMRVREWSLPPPDRPSEDGRTSPKIPPKTYMWEEVKRSRLRGGYPWTHLYKGSFDEAKWKEIMEHEYEYVDPRPELLRPEPIRPQVTVRVSPSPEPEKPKQQRRFIRIPDSEQVIIPLHGSSDEEHNPDRYTDPELLGQEEIGLTPPSFRPSPSPSPSRRRGSPEIGIKDRLRTTAGHLGSKIRKISIPDKSKIRLPEKSKFLAGIQQIKLPEKPKFLKEKPKFLTEKPKFLTEKPKFLTERPKFLKEGIKFPDRPKINMPTIRLPKSRRQRPKETSVKSEFGSEKNIFQTIKARTYPRFLNKKKRERTKKATPPPRQTKFDSESLPSTPRSKRNEKWSDVYKQKTFGEESKAASYTGNGESFHERYSKREATRASSSSIVDSDREQASSGSSTQRHRAGVIEEIDSDEFFVRVKGISREDVQVSRYLSSEIRDAFRSPKNALASLDKEDFDDEEPLPPHRSKKPKEYPRKEFNTFPLRPSRSKKGKRGTMEKPPRKFRSKAKQSSLPSLNRDQEFEMEVEPIQTTKEPPLPPTRKKSSKSLTTGDNWTDEAKIVPDEGMALESEVKIEYDAPVAPVRKARSRGTSLADEDRTSRGAESIKSDMQIEDELNDEEFHMEEELREKDIKSEGEIVKHSYKETETALMTPPKITIDDVPAYSNVSKLRPSRPPPPQNETQDKEHTPQNLKSKILGHRRMQQLQSWKNQGVNFFFTYPRRAIKNFNRAPPKRPVRNYSTIAGPTRPPRRHKVFREPVYVDADIDPADGIPFIDEDDRLRSYKSDDVLDGMKGRPLPPPPRTHPVRYENEDVEFKTSLTTEEMNILNDLASKEEEVSMEALAIDDSEKSEDVHDRMQGRPLPPPPRKKRGSRSTERKQASTASDLNTLNDLNGKTEDVVLDASISTGASEMTTVVSAGNIKPSNDESKIEKSEIPTRPTRQEEKKATIEISQQTSFDVAEITVSVQTDPLPEGAIVEEVDEILLKSKPHESDEEPTIEKYLEKYGSEIKLLGRQNIPAKVVTAPEIRTAPSPARPITQQTPQKEEELIERIEREIIPSSVTSAESGKNINKIESKIVEKSIPIAKETPKKEAPQAADETKPVPISLPDRLHLSHLDVDSLNVSSLKASQILVSDLTGQSMQVTELTSRGGNLVVSGMEFPPGFIQSLASEITAKVEEKGILKPAVPPQRPPQPLQKMSAEIVQVSQTKSSEAGPAPASESPQPQKLTVVTAPPPIVVQPSAEALKPPSPEIGLLSGSDSIPAPRTTRNRGKKSGESRIVDDSEDELATTLKKSPRSSPSRQAGPSTSPPPPTGASGLTARQLLVELLKIWKSFMVEGFNACSNTVGSMFPEGQKRREAQTAACVLFIIIIGLFALGFGTDNTVHYHHWDYIPPRL